MQSFPPPPAPLADTVVNLYSSSSFNPMGRFATTPFQVNSTKYPAQLIRQFQSRFPLIASNNKRDSWAETSSTDPAHHANQAYRYIVHGMKRPAEDGSSKVKYWQLLATPTTIQNWVAISCSVIDQAHRVTYRPYGLILRVPKSNVLTAHSADQMFSNHAGADVPVGASMMDKIKLAAEIKNHIIGKDAQYGA